MNGMNPFYRLEFHDEFSTYQEIKPRFPGNFCFILDDQLLLTNIRDSAKFKLYR